MNTKRDLRIKQLNLLLEKQPNDPFLRYAYALEIYLSGDLDTAEKQFCDLIDVSPEYTATYYHLAKLYEQKNDKQKAIETYKQGIEITQKLRDMHALSELRSALNELEFED